MTETHNRRRILRKYFMAWQSWITSKQQLETLHDNQEKTKSKMAAFLEAAASGKLWTNRNEDTMEGPAESGKRERSGHRSGSDAQNNVVRDLCEHHRYKQEIQDKCVILSFYM